MIISRRQALLTLGGVVLGTRAGRTAEAGCYRFGGGTNVSYRFGKSSANGVATSTVDVATPPAERSTRILYFGAPWCGYCRDVEEQTFPQLRSSGWTIGDASCYIEICDPEATTFDIDGLPAWLLISKGKIQKQMTGFRDHMQVAKWFNDFLKPTSRKTSSRSPARVPSGGNWTHSGGPLIDHCVSHGYARHKLQPLSHGQLVFVHSYAHNNSGRLYPIPSTSRSTRSRSRRRAASCPSCPR